jgi:S-adenosylmethionine synthetase
MIAETEASEVTIRLLSSIGHSVTEPQAVHIETTGSPDPDIVLDIAEDCFADWAGVTDRLIDGRYELY